MGTWGTTTSSLTNLREIYLPLLYSILLLTIIIILIPLLEHFIKQLVYINQTFLCFRRLLISLAPPYVMKMDFVTSELNLLLQLVVYTTLKAFSF
ncbi:hypothetical protein L2E82_31788 [Cichorium intybus]|uniref:Uncharacterized protein n=1 Tax=Cichorium intybus TaxID=13427 RepID=A0ACB9BE75_CICIN|nr:hypothetical protein L2E82_31788 [Cichorium intybus]